MKKIMSAAVLLLGILFFISCEKTENNTTNTCTGENAFLLPDSLTSKFCEPNYSYFALTNPNRTIKLATSIVAVDTIINGGWFIIKYDSTGSLPCAGMIMKEVNLECYTRLP